MKCPYCEKKLERTYYETLQANGLPKKYHEEIITRTAKYLSCESCGVYFLILFDNSVYIWFSALFDPTRNKFFWEEFDSKEYVVFT